MIQNLDLKKKKEKKVVKKKVCAFDDY